MSDQTIFDRINDLSHEEEALWSRASESGGLDANQQQRLEVIGVELDQCFDLLHQRQARRSAGLDPEEAQARPAEVVERYVQ
jgi:hypothetical protein